MMKYILIFSVIIFEISYAKELVCRENKEQLVDQVLYTDFLGGCPILGDKSSIGNGYIQSYLLMDGENIKTMGFVFPEETLENLPPRSIPHDGLHCFDINNDGVITNESECAGGHQRPLFLPPHNFDTPISWLLLNWNPRGHQPVGIYDHPHFDFHFYIQDFFGRNSIEMGTCGGHTNCDVYAKAIKDLPGKYMPKDYINAKAVEAKMGNHLVDPSSHEFNPQSGHHFTHTFIWGSYDGHITFMEPMITLAFLQKKTSACYPIKMPKAFEVKGYYPTKYCIRFENNYYITLEKFEYQKGE